VVEEPGAVGLAYVLHGVLGAGHNFRSFIKRLAAQRPEWRFVLVDLRHHGRSQGAPSPNTLEACVHDLQELSEALGETPQAVVGHSFGGKVALAYARALSRAEKPSGNVLRQVWTLDSNPGAQEPSPDHEVLRVVSALRASPGPFPVREAAVRALTEGQGLSSGLAQWLTTNLERRGEQFVWRFDLDAIAELLDDYFRQDLWPYLAQSRGLPEHHLVVAERSDRWTGSMRDRVRTLPAAAAVTLHELPDAGHWVHVDNPDGLLDILRTHLCAPA
jgi:pimeloyl-ACP methyl ester carboxylesterase